MSTAQTPDFNAAEPPGASPAQIRDRLVRRGWLSGLIILAGAGTGYIYGGLAPASYTAQAYIVASAKTPGDTVSATAFATAYSRIAGQPQILDAAATASGFSAQTLHADTAAQLSPDAPVIAIGGSAHNAADAAKEANAVANALVALATTHESATAVSLTLLSAAEAPTTPSSTSPTLDAAIGGGAGVVLTALAALAGVGTGEGAVRRPRRAACEIPVATCAGPDEHESPLGTVEPSGSRMRASLAESPTEITTEINNNATDSEQQGAR